MDLSYIIILLFIILIFYICFSSTKTNESTNGLKYYICNQYKNKENHIFVSILENNNFERTFSNNWNVYFPCGYNFNEIELYKLNMNFMNNYKGKYIFAIHGSDQIVGKIKLWNHLTKFYDRKVITSIISESFDFNSVYQQKLFEESYEKGNIYVIKSKAQKQLGIVITDNLEEIKKNYRINNILVQKFIKNQLLIKNYHFNIRVFVLVTFKNRDMNIYLYNEGNIRYAAKPYNSKTIQQESLITKGVSADKSIYDDKPFSITDLKLYLKNNNIDYEKINKSIKDIITLIFNCMYYQIGQYDRIQQGFNFQLFGGDFMVTNDLKTYFLEFNKGPELGCVKGLQKECQMKQVLQRDIFKLVGLDKSDFKSPYRFDKVFSKNK
jgi:hypothetical protein